MKSLNYTTDEGLDIEYTFWHDKGDYHNEEDCGVEIEKITYNNMDVTDLLFNIAHRYMDEMIDELETKHKKL